MENSILPLADENSKLNDFMGINIGEKYTRDFLNYYHRYDPFHLIQGPFHGNKVITLEDLVPYPTFIKTEYYNDFLHPQRIHYKTVIYLKSEVALLGIIGLFRPKEFGNFSKKDIRIVKILTPYLSQALKNINIFRKIQFENSVLKLVDRESTSGFVILNDSLELVHMNQQAKDFYRLLEGPNNGNRKPRNGENHYPPVPNLIKEDCYQLKDQMKHGSFEMIPLPIYRILRLSESKKYSLCSKILPKEMNPEKQLFYSIKIDELTHQVNLNIGALEMDFCLTKREIEILVDIFNELKNAEIAEKLFISEATVKKHLQHIFEKIGVDSRTALIRKIIEYQSTKP